MKLERLFRRLADCLNVGLDRQEVQLMSTIALQGHGRLTFFEGFLLYLMHGLDCGEVETGAHSGPIHTDLVGTSPPPPSRIHTRSE